MPNETDRESEDVAVVLGRELVERVDAFAPILSRRMGVTAKRWSRNALVEYLVTRGLEAEGAASLTAIDADG